MWNDDLRDAFRSFPRGAEFAQALGELRMAGCSEKKVGPTASVLKLESWYDERDRLMIPTVTKSHVTKSMQKVAG